MITTCNPKGCFPMAVLQSKDTFSHCFFLSSVNNSLAPELGPRPQLSPGCPGVCGAAKFSSFPRKQHQSHPSSLGFLPSQQLKGNIPSILHRVLWLCFYF